MWDMSTAPGARRLLGAAQAEASAWGRRGGGWRRRKEALDVAGKDLRVSSSGSPTADLHGSCSFPPRSQALTSPSRGVSGWAQHRELPEAVLCVQLGFLPWASHLCSPGGSLAFASSQCQRLGVTYAVSLIQTCWTESTCSFPGQVQDDALPAHPQVLLLAESIQGALCSEGSVSEREKECW